MQHTTTCGAAQKTISGSIDYDYYADRAHALRSDAVMQILIGIWRRIADCQATIAARIEASACQSR